MSVPLLGWLGAVAIGVSLGLFGSGGSILTVPVLVYLFHQEEKVAIAGSLAVVAVVALSRALIYARARMIEWRQLCWFGLPSVAGTYAGAWRRTCSCVPCRACWAPDKPLKTPAP